VSDFTFKHNNTINVMDLVMKIVGCMR